MKLSQPVWMIGVGNLLGLASVGLGLALVFAGLVSPWWLLPWPVMHALSSLMVTVGLHRYWSHGAFQTNRFWHQLMNWYSVFLLLGSPIAWAAAHIAHHIHSDTERDPHHTGLDYMVWKRYNRVPVVRVALRRLLADRSVVFVHRHGMAIWIIGVTLLALVSWQVLLYGYLMALGSVHLIGALHQVLSHNAGAPRDLAVLEYVLPAFGEWMHATHHASSRRPDLRARWWHLDLGYCVIRMIRVPNRPAST